MYFVHIVHEYETDRRSRETQKEWREVESQSDRRSKETEQTRERKKRRDKDGRVGLVATLINKLSHGLIFRGDSA